MSEMFFYGLVVGNLAGSTLVLIWIFIIHQNCLSSTATNTTCPVNFICPTMIFRTTTDENVQDICIKLVEKNKDVPKNARNKTKEKLKEVLETTIDKINNIINSAEAKDKKNEVSEEKIEGFYEAIENASEDKNNTQDKKTKVSFVDTVDKIKDITDLAKVKVDDVTERNKGRHRGSRYKLFINKND